MASKRVDPKAKPKTKRSKSSPKSVASKGGLARKASLSPEERREIAKNAAQERWAAVRGLPKETHAGILQLGPGIPCSVLDNGQRVFSVTGLFRAFGAGAKSRVALEDGTAVPEFLAASNLQPHISAELRSRLVTPVEFRGKHGGSSALGYRADIINLICDALLDARGAGVLRANQLRIAASAETLVRAFSRVGIIALIDEATGYQADRASDELQRLVEAYVVEDMRPWVSLFPEAFFRQVYRIHGWQYKPGITQGPRYVGKFINKYVYSRLPERVLARLRELNPVIGTRRKRKHFQFLTELIGEPTVDRHLASVTTLMSVATTKQHFEDMFRTAFPKPGEQMLMPGFVETATLVGPPAGEDDDEDDDAILVATGQPAPAPPALFGGVEVVPVAARTSERILAALRQHDRLTFEELAMAAYSTTTRGPSAEARNTSNKLRRLLERMRAEGLVMSAVRGVWSLHR